MKTAFRKVVCSAEVYHAAGRVFIIHFFNGMPALFPVFLPDFFSLLLPPLSPRGRQLREVDFRWPGNEEGPRPAEIPFHAGSNCLM